MFGSGDNTVVYPPNKAIERKMEFSKTPTVYDHLLFIDFNEKGEAIVGSSNVSGTLWEGTLLHFEDEALLQPLNYGKTYINCTISDGKFLNDQTIVLAEDTGILTVASVTSKEIKHVNYFRHIDRIPKIAVWKNSPRVVTCSGNCVTIWDANNSTERKPLQHYENYHTDLVNYVDTFKTEPNIFVSASMDRKCCLWDQRESSPASVLYNNEFCSLTSVACNQNNANYVVVGTEAGDIYLIDRREPAEFISVSNCNFDIYRIVFDEHSSRLAVCGDTDKVLVFKCEDEIINNAYCNDKHSGIVRGLAWYNETLYSCGFDKQVVKHVFN